MTMPLPPLRTAGHAWTLLWRHRLLHARAIWPPVVFLVTSEFLYHRIVGNADGIWGHVGAVLAAPWYMTAGVVVAWLAGLKFLLSFSISWRRHLLLGDRFDPFFFGRPFWRYLGFLLLTYAWIVPLLLLSLVPAAWLAVRHASHAALLAAGAVPVLAVGFAIWAVVRQVPFFTSLTFDRPHPGWRMAVGAMRGTVWRYIGAFVVAMLPVLLLNFALDTGLKLAGADRHAVGVALGESVFRQAMLFVHFALGAAIGAITTTTLFPDVATRP